MGSGIATGGSHPGEGVMKITIMLSVAILAAGCAHNSGPAATTAAQSKAAEADAALAAMLSKRIAGPPQDCVSEVDLGGNKSYGRGAILFGDRSGDVVYVNRPAAGCPDLGVGQALKTRTTTTQLCRGDIVTVFDPVSGIEFGSCTLGQFTPYRRAR